MSDLSQPPEACFRGKLPFWIQRKSVERFTPTTRKTSAVLILWSSARILGRSDLPVGARRGFGFERGASRRSDSCCGQASPLVLLPFARTVGSGRVCKDAFASSARAGEVTGTHSLAEEGAERPLARRAC